MHQSDRVWSLLAGGEGERLRPFINRWLGEHKPKQYCTFVGTRSLFQHTVDRADTISCALRRIIVAATSHRHCLREQLAGKESTVVFRPANRGIAAGNFVPLALMLRNDP